MLGRLLTELKAMCPYSNKYRYGGVDINGVNPLILLFAKGVKRYTMDLPLQIGNKMAQAKGPLTPGKFEWGIDPAGYRVSRDRQRIESIGGDPSSYCPDDVQPPLLRRFSELWSPGHEEAGDEADGALRLVSTMGFFGTPASGYKLEMENVAYIAAQSRKLSVFLAFGIGPGLLPGRDQSEAFNTYNQLSASMRIQLEAGPDGPEIRIVPTSLISWLWLQVAREITEGLVHKSCQRCGNSFTVGRDSRERRRIYCSNACRVAAFRQSKTQGGKP